jgi:hypothetical protein
MVQKQAWSIKNYGYVGDVSWIFTYIIFTCVKRKEDSGAVATHGH